eukprot:7378729-Prymnesium_polylepis.1
MVTFPSLHLRHAQQGKAHREATREALEDQSLRCGQQSVRRGAPAAKHPADWVALRRTVCRPQVVSGDGCAPRHLQHER